MKVIWKYNGKDEQVREFADPISAMRFQAEVLKHKKRLEYATFERN